MTAIVGLCADDGDVYIGGDSSGVAGYSLTVRADEKVFLNGKFVLGFTSSFRMGQLLRYDFHPPSHESDADLSKYMVSDFIPEVRKCLTAGGYNEKLNNVESGGTFLVGHQGRLFRIGTDFQVGQSVETFDAVGSGADIALGCMHATPSTAPAERVTEALRAAERFNVGVRGPFRVVKLEKAK